MNKAFMPIIAIAGAFLVSDAASSAAAGPAQDGALMCAACHGAQGEGAPDGIPRLAGQNAAYLNHALSMFKGGTRASLVMQPVAESLSDADMRQLAEYFSNQKAPLAGAQTPASPEFVLAGRKLAETGSANAAPCFSCHAADGKGNGARFPAIAGQPAQFVVNRLHEFQVRARGTVPQADTMTAVAATLSERQIEEAAAYLAQLAR
jgi:cytochrome c553